MEKTIDITIYETKAILKECLGRSELHVSVLKMILNELYLEISELAEKSLENNINKYNQELALKEQEGKKDGEHKQLPDGNT